MPELKDYMPRSAGVAAGDRGGEVERVQAYLRKFGYLESPALQDFGARTRLAAPPAAEEGVFD